MDAARSILDVSAAEAAEDLRRSAPGMEALLDLTMAFDRACRREKLRRNATDFADQEHYAVRLLLGEDGTPTELADTVSQRYREVMVDEYQDTNQVQNCVFSAISHGGRTLFAVGDVKQSIYRFRLADPAIFLEKYETYPLADQAEEGQPRKILLSQNFRSRQPVLDGGELHLSGHHVPGNGGDGLRGRGAAPLRRRLPASPGGLPDGVSPADLPTGPGGGGRPPQPSPGGGPVRGGARPAAA